MLPAGVGNAILIRDDRVRASIYNVQVDRGGSRDADRKIAEMMSSYWANFATTGDPNGKGLPHWPSVSEKPGMTMEVGDTTAPIRIAGDKAKEEFFTQYFSKSRPSQRP